jgi:D-amino peptidase
VKVYISVDMEGLAGVSHADPTEPGKPGYDAAVRLMVGETNATIEGAFRGGAREVVVNDSHWHMHNLTPADLDPRATVIQGRKPWSMVEGAGPDRGFEVALFVGYHARAGHPTGTIAHTYSDAPVEVRINGRKANEAALNAMVLGAWGVPVGLVAGDDALAEETEDWLPWAARVVVKRAVSRYAAASVHPSVAQGMLRTAAHSAVDRARNGELALLDVGSPVVVEVDFRDGGEADMAAIVPGAERFDDRSVRYVAPDPVGAYRAFLAGIRIVG